MFSGSAYVETGGEEFVLEEGQFGYIPPNAPHNFLGPASGHDACLFCVVAPNLADNKWRVRDFRPAAEALRIGGGDAVRG
jgi:mannose-6-phosphate isomerase-like protein (cupin superfamily)